MSSKIWIWKKVPGITGRYNDLIYSRPILPRSQDILVYFGGDVQDVQENMEQHEDSKRYTEWSLENTARTLSTNFFKMHVLIIRPSRMYITRSSMFSCFDNFVPSNEYGVPSFLPTYNALKHLMELVKSSLEHVRMCNTDEDLTDFNIDKTKLTLMGFSKGCVVLNQLLHEFHYYQSKSEPDMEISDFIKYIKSMWWLDGGHGGFKNTWITEESILKSFFKLNIAVNIHVTPYQIQDPYRTWIREEENQFCSTLKNMGIPVNRTVHFVDQPKNLKSHFNVLKVVRNNDQEYK